jgi:hypothetical protein
MSTRTNPVYLLEQIEKILRPAAKETLPKVERLPGVAKSDAGRELSEFIDKVWDLLPDIDAALEAEKRRK